MRTAIAWPGTRSMGASIVLAVAPVVLVMVAGAVLLLSAHYRSAVADLQESRFAYAASALRNSAESSLRLGLPLADLDYMESAMAAALDRDIAILSIDLFDDQGRLLFTTDRAGIGDAVPDPWILASNEAQAEFWRRTERGVAVLGTPIINSFDQRAGGLALRYDPGGGRFGGAASAAFAYRWAAIGGVALLALGWLAAFLALNGTQARGRALAARIAENGETPDGSSVRPSPVGGGGTSRSSVRLTRFLGGVGAARRDMDATSREIARIDEED